MKPLWLALALALAVAPIAVMADDNPSTAAAPGLTSAQRQAIQKTMEAFRDKERTLHQAMRAQILGALSPEHRTAVAGAIGEMVIAENPDPAAVAKQIDGLLSPGERQAILAAHTAFVNQTQTLLQQMHAQLQSELPAGAQGHHWQNSGMMQRPPAAIANDAGNVVMMVLAHRSPMGMEMGDHHGGMMPEGPPPGGPPPGGPPPAQPPAGGAPPP
ncbi:MAG: hypothetical protein JOZ01_01785 [Candidatus Eremiobacteraeota bacterium]|nr:hypothetical protein [Candidatus Eremiobacteraeota bacterium]